MADQQLEQIVNELLKHLERYDDQTIQQIKEVTKNDEIYSVKINPKIRLFNKVSNLKILDNKDYKDFIKSMAKRGLYVHTNLDDFKIQKLDTLNKVSHPENSKPKGSNRIPDLETMYFSKNAFTKQFAGFMRDRLFKRTYFKS